MENRNEKLRHVIGDALGLSPRDALQRIAGPRAGNQARNHVGRDVTTLRRAGIEPEKIGRRWVVRAGELERWAAGQTRAEAEPVSQVKAKRGPGRPRKSFGRLAVQTKTKGGAL